MPMAAAASRDRAQTRLCRYFISSSRTEADQFWVSGGTTTSGSLQLPQRRSRTSKAQAHVRSMRAKPSCNAARAELQTSLGCRRWACPTWSRTVEQDHEVGASLAPRPAAPARTSAKRPAAMRSIVSACSSLESRRVRRRRRDGSDSRNNSRSRLLVTACPTAGGPLPAGQETAPCDVFGLAGLPRAHDECGMDNPVLARLSTRRSVKPDRLLPPGPAAELETCRESPRASPITRSSCRGASSCWRGTRARRWERSWRRLASPRRYRRRRRRALTPSAAGSCARPSSSPSSRAYADRARRSGSKSFPLARPASICVSLRMRWAWTAGSPSGSPIGKRPRSARSCRRRAHRRFRVRRHRGRAAGGARTPELLRHRDALEGSPAALLENATGVNPVFT